MFTAGVDGDIHFQQSDIKQFTNSREYGASSISAAMFGGHLARYGRARAIGAELRRVSAGQAPEPGRRNRGRY